MSAYRRAKTIIALRRVVQGLVLVLFLALVLWTRGPEEGEPSGLLSVFFDLDPLVLLGAWISARGVAGLSLLALVTVAVTFLLGRVFCGWFCPFGTLHNMVSWMRARKDRRRLGSDAFSRWQRGKYYILFGLIALSLLGGHWIGVFDPFALFYRSVATGLLPAAQYAVEGSSTAVYEADPHIGAFHFTSITEPVYRFFRDTVFVVKRTVFTGNTLLFLIFLAAVLLNLRRTRFWCRYVCPLGAFLGLVARRSPLRLQAGEGECGGCGLCSLSCPAAAQPDKPGEWLPTECYGCWNCVAACRQDAIDFGFESPFKRPEAGTIDLGRRAALASVAVGAGALLTFRLAPEAQGKTYNPLLIRPPGSRPEPEFLDRCVRCGMCMKVCPTNALHPTGLQAGLEGIWTPVLVPRVGYCEFECNLCGLVCPTSAIEPLPLAEKKKVKMGLATFDITRCLPYAHEKDCIVCEEHCPIPTKAIYFMETEVRLREGGTRVFKQPRVDAELCTGCGICENVCPFEDWPAVRMTSAGETRHPGNQPLLPTAGAGGTVPDWAFEKPAAVDSATADPYGY
ncbi:MAG: 4Fe-4S dicluster domain-containing protein [Candidatus Eisenbacteria bacterium]